MNLNVNYDRLVGEVLGDCVPVAREKFRVLSQKADTRSVLDEHARRYMEAQKESELYSPFQDFAEKLFRSAELPFHFIQTHEKPLRNDRPTQGDPKRKSVALFAPEEFH